MFAILIPYSSLLALMILIVARRCRDPHRAAMWILIVILLPFVGMMLYLMMGHHKKLTYFNGRTSGQGVAGVVESYTHVGVRLHNSVELLPSGAETFARLIGVLHRARCTINLEYYILKDDPLGRTVVDILVRRSRAGVKVRVMLDFLGSWFSARGLIARMRSEGIEVICFERLRSPLKSCRLNCRNHRKIMIVDSRMAMVGGVNLAQYYMCGNALGRWRDEHIYFEGEAVADLESLFLRDWIYSGGSNFFSPQRVEIDFTQLSPMQILYSEPGSLRHAMQDVFMAIIMRCKSHLYISSPYFMPPRPLLEALSIAVRSGVDVKILVPSRSTSRLLDMVADSFMLDLLAAGVEVYRFKEGFTHSKVLIADDYVASVGSANMDYRSMECNLEVAALLYDRGLIGHLSEEFLAEIDRAELLTLEGYYEQTTLISRSFADLARVVAPIL